MNKSNIMKRLENVVAEEHVKEYYKNLLGEIDKAYRVASEARKRGFDVATEVETKPVADLADRAETIIGPKGVAKRYRELMEKIGERDKVIFQIFREILEEKWCSIADREKRLEQAIKTALVLATEGVVVAPLDGVPKVKISKNPDGTEYVDIYYAGPIRAAGGTSAVLPLILGDYARKILKLDRYKPTEDEIERYVEEVRIYESIFSRQYKLSDDEVRKIIRGCPVCINGEPTEEREVVIYRDLPRVHTNRVRGGACLVLSEGIALKAKKILKFAKQLGLDWSWLESIIKIEKGSAEATTLTPVKKYLEGLAAGRPVFSYPMRFGGFRLRYGRTRATGIMCKALHPATMYVLDEFVAVATQLKVERPGKAAGITPCDSIEGPIVKLKSGEVKKIETVKEAISLAEDIEEILFLGDILVPLGDFFYSAHPLPKVGYCEEWWQLELEEALKKEKPKQGIVAIANKAIRGEINAEEAIKLSKELKIPLYPKYCAFFERLQNNEIIKISEELKKNELNKGKIRVSNKLKEIFEKICLPHRVVGNEIEIDENYSAVIRELFYTKDIEKQKELAKEIDEPLELIEKISGIKLREKGGTFIGARMGRPEAAGERIMRGSPHVLFPIELYGGSTRSIVKALRYEDNSRGKIEVEVVNYKCPKCGKMLVQPFCRDCNERAVKVYVCKRCKREVGSERCPYCGEEAEAFSKRRINLTELINTELKFLGTTLGTELKGVKGVINKDKIPEPIGKGIIRAKYNLHVFRDATIRYESINAPLTHFKPREIGISVEKAKELGYKFDINGKELTSEDQIVELYPQDIIINKKAAEFFVKVAKFIDELLEKYYKMPKFYNIDSKEQLIGELVLGLAPHTSAAIVGRIIGFTKARACFAHPYFHQTKRRNVDGDQDSLMLLMDGLLNFSESYLPSSRGGRMDAPLVFTTVLDPSEIDEEVHEMERCWRYPLELYKETYEKGVINSFDGIERVKDLLGKEKQYSGFGYTHETSDFANGPTTSRYVQLNTMEEKLERQALLQKKIRCVDTKDSLEKTIISHLMPDIIGNARAFGRQTFRCTNCNAKFRRIPLSGRCTNCGRGNVILTIAQGSVKKYLDITKRIVEKYNLSDYLKQRVELIEQEIFSVFKEENIETKKVAAKEKQQRSLAEFA